MLHFFHQKIIKKNGGKIMWILFKPHDLVTLFWTGGGGSGGRRLIVAWSKTWYYSSFLLLYLPNQRTIISFFTLVTRASLFLLFLDQYSRSFLLSLILLTNFRILCAIDRDFHAFLLRSMLLLLFIYLFIIIVIIVIFGVIVDSPFIKLISKIERVCIL